MKLEKYRVQKFRSIEDSGWINLDDVVALIGENESGKTNALVPLWKLNPAVSDSANMLNLLKDYPRSQYKEIHSAKNDSELKLQKFITAIYSLDEEDKSEIKRRLSCDIEFTQLEMSRDYNNSVSIRLLDGEMDCVEQYHDKLISDLKKAIEQISQEDLKCELSELLSSAKHSEIVAKLQNSEYSQEEETIRVRKACEPLIAFKGIKDKVNGLLDIVPKFIYYSTYENLDSDVFLPDVISGVASKEKKSRTLKTLFKFVNLSPEEISALGHSPNNNVRLSDEEKAKLQFDTATRQTLLESASTDFTKKFNEWWQQDTKYVFKFEADGDTFRIKVADDKRTDLLELSSRSSGLQWFFSFFLVFLVESEGLHKNAILLLDEPGVTLHPNAQKQLYLFFNNLSESNQFIYTTHSPFMINPNQLDKVYAVYVNEMGISCIAPDLRASSRNRKLNNSIYPAHAALGLSVSDTLLNGCYPVIVEGISDQIYFSLIKNSMIRNGKLNTQKEIVFIPSDGVKGIKAILQILAGLQNESYPYIVLDGDKAGKALLNSLTQKDGLYCGKADRVLSLDCLFANAEVEDLMPFDILKSTINSYIPKASECDDTFEDIAIQGTPICDQIIDYISSNGLSLPDGSKVEIAENFKRRINKKNIDLYGAMSDTQKKVVDKIFSSILKD